MPNYRIIGGDRKEYGPVSETELRQWINEGRLNAQSLAQIEGGVEWKALGTFPEFADALRAQTGTLPLAPGAPADRAAWTNEILAREPDLRLGECLASGGKFFASNFGFVFGAVFVAWLVNTVMAFLPVIGGIVHLLLGGVVLGGLYLACLRRMRGEPARVADVFDGFKLCFVQLMLAGALSKLLTQIGFFLCLVPGIYLVVAWCFALPLVADKRLEFWSAMELSRKVVTRVWFQAGLLLFVAFLPVIGFQFVMAAKFTALFLGLARDVDFDVLKLVTSIQQNSGEIMKVALTWAGIAQVVLLLNLLFAVGAVMRAYENLFGPRQP